MTSSNSSVRDDYVIIIDGLAAAIVVPAGPAGQENPGLTTAEGAPYGDPGARAGGSGHGRGLLACSAPPSS